MTINLQELQQLIEQKYIAVQKHKEAALYIYNYTPQAQYERVWNELTLQCRGLILDAAGKVVARPFKKFFNLEEHQPGDIPAEPFDVYEKLDGSLGILYWLNDTPMIATRGSFESDQSRKATQWLHTKYASAIPQLRKDRTYIFEIIYPENRIVVDYGNQEELILLGILNTQTGQDLPLETIGFPLVQRFDGINDLQQLKQLNLKNKEGFVLKFKSGFRVKVKFEEYVRLHRILTQVSNQTIWEKLKDGLPLEDILDKVPDEFYDWVRDTETKLRQAYTEIENSCKADFRELEDRKATAMYFLTCKHPGILFSMLDKRRYETAIWRLLKPKYEKPFRNETEE